MFSRRSSVFARFAGRTWNIFGKKAAQVITAKASVPPNDTAEAEARSPFDMAKLAQASSPFTSNDAVDKQALDMSKLATEVKTCATHCSGDCSSCSAAAHNSLQINATPEPSESESASSSLDACGADDLQTGSDDTSSETIVEMPGVEMSGSQQAETLGVSARDKGMAARLRVVAAMNGPKALRARRLIKRSTLARPAPVKRKLAARRMSSTALVTWPAYTGRIAALSRSNSEALTLNSQIIALREKASLGRAATSGMGRAIARAA